MSEEESYLMIRPLKTRTISLIGLAESDWRTNLRVYKKYRENRGKTSLSLQLEFLIGLFLSHKWTTKFVVFLL